MSTSISADQDDQLGPIETSTMLLQANKKTSKKRPLQREIVDKEQPAKCQKQELENSDLEELWKKLTTALDNLDKLEGSNEESYEYDYVFNRLDEIFSKHKDTLKKTNKSTALLRQAASRGHLDIVKYLVEEQEVDPKSKDKKGAMALHCAASEGYLDIVKYLVEELKVDPRSENEEKATALHYAAAGRQEIDNKKVIEYLVQQGIELNETFNGESSVLGLAVATANLSIVEYWIEYYSEKKEKWNDGVKKLTESALKVAKYRETNRKKERGLQSHIADLLSKFLESKQ
jgi:hypothetical protein